MEAHGLKQIGAVVGAAGVAQWAKQYATRLWTESGGEPADAWRTMGPVSAVVGGFLSFKGKGAVQYAGFGLLAHAAIAYVQRSNLGWSE